MQKIISKMDAKNVINSLEEYGQIKLRPNGTYGNLTVIISKNSWVEHYENDIVIMEDKPTHDIINKLYEYRKAYNNKISRY